MQHEWDPLLDDLEHQFAAQQQAERRELDTERERARIATLRLVDRLRAVAGEDVRVVLGGRVVRGAVRQAGADWFALADEQGGVVVAPVAAVERVVVGDRQASRAARQVEADPLGDRMTFGFAMRALGRRRAPVAVWEGDRVQRGTIARAGADHLDLAVRDPDDATRRGERGEIAFIPFARISGVRLARRGDHDAV